MGPVLLRGLPAGFSSGKCADSQAATWPPGLLAPVHSDLGRPPSGPSGGAAMAEHSGSRASSPGPKGDAGNRDLLARQKTITNWAFRGHIGIKIQKESPVKK